MAWIEKKRYNIIFLLFGIFGNLAAPLITNFIGLKIPFFSDYVLHWANLCSPFNLMIALGAFGVCSKWNFSNRFINGVSSLTLYIYLIHENLLFRTYLRPYLWQQIYLHFGYAHVIGWALLMAIGLFSASLLLGFIYSLTIRKLTHRLSAKLLAFCRKIGDKIFSKYETTEDEKKA